MSDKTVTVNIVSRWGSDKVLFSAEVDAITGERYRLRAALEIGVKQDAYLRGACLRGAYLSDADLRGANLRGADLSGAYLSDANLRGADLSGADLRYAYLRYAYLRYAYLRYADLSGANLRGANLRGADLSGARLRGDLKLAGKRPYFQLSPIGSESRTFEAFITNHGLRLRAGCFFGTRDEFVAKLNQTHGDNMHAHEYTAALSLIDAHYELWAPKDAQQEAV